jgi:hypothetical protein
MCIACFNSEDNNLAPTHRDPTGHFPENISDVLELWLTYSAKVFSLTSIDPLLAIFLQYIRNGVLFFKKLIEADLTEFTFKNKLFLKSCTSFWITCSDYGPTSK